MPKITTISDAFMSFQHMVNNLTTMKSTFFFHAQIILGFPPDIIHDMVLSHDIESLDIVR
jgi:hypothetical protein